MSSYLAEDDGIFSPEEIAEMAAPCAGAVEPFAAEPVSPESEYAGMLARHGGSHRDAMFEYCFRHDVPYRARVLGPILSSDEGGDGLPGSYLAALSGRVEGSDPTTFFGQLRRENFERLYSEDYAVSLLSEDDRKNRLQVIEILGYDPFKDDAPDDKPQLYRDMTGMLTEAMRKDVAKARAALAVVRGYNNIDKYQRKINAIMSSMSSDEVLDEDTQKRLDQYIKLQKTLQDSVNQTAEKNNFTTKGIGTAGRGMLSDVMLQIEEKGIDEGIPNFYDVATSRSIEEVANISFKALLNQINLSKTDYVDILTAQCEAVRKAQADAAAALEGLRLAKEKLRKQELLDELAEDYRRKGISEAEIEEFVRREYKMYDGTE